MKKDKVHKPEVNIQENVAQINNTNLQKDDDLSEDLNSIKINKDESKSFISKFWKKIGDML